jgi:hypothetical protein
MNFENCSWILKIGSRFFKEFQDILISSWISNNGSWFFEFFRYKICSRFLEIGSWFSKFSNFDFFEISILNIFWKFDFNHIFLLKKTDFQKRLKKEAEKGRGVRQALPAPPTDEGEERPSIPSLAS